MFVGVQASFDGVPLEDLVFDDVDWTQSREHVEGRALRKGTAEFAPRIEWATQACRDPSALVGRTAAAVVVVGWSSGAQRLLVVILQPAEHASQGRWIGLTAYAANTQRCQRYEEQS